MDNEKNDIIDIFLTLSKAIIIFPIIVVIIALIYKFNQTDKTNKTVKTISPTIQQQKVISQQKINIDLKGPLVCRGSFDDMEIAGYIKDKMIKIILSQKKITKYIVFSGDCYYRWQESQYVGERVCGLSPLLGVVEMMIGLGGVNLNMISEQLIKLGLDKKTATDEAKISSFMNSCKKQEIDSKIYEVPKNILFKNIK